MNKFFARLVNFSLQQILIFGVVAGLAYYFFIFDDGSGYRGDIANLQSELAKQEEKKKETDAALKEETRMKEVIVQLSQKYQEISRRLPMNLSSIELNRNVDAFARNSGTSIKARKPLAPVEKEIVTEVPIQVTLEGSFAELAQFVQLVASSERVTTVRNYVMTPIDSRGSRLKFEGRVVGYQLSEEKPEPKKRGTP